MEFSAKTFDELTNRELYEILKARAKIFLMEQHIIYVDADGKDFDSLHCFFFDGEKITAYLRAFSSGFDTVTVGRVLTIDHGKGHGKMLLEKSITAIKEHFNCNKISGNASVSSRVVFVSIKSRLLNMIIASLLSAKNSIFS